jgi:hypothetical protein
VWTLADRSNPGKSREMAAVYLTHYGTARGITDPVALARIWNGGPRGHCKRATVAYGRRFAEALKAVDQMRRGPDLSEVRAAVRKPLISVYGQPMGGKSAVLVFDRKLEEALKKEMRRK